MNIYSVRWKAFHHVPDCEGQLDHDVEGRDFITAADTALAERAVRTMIKESLHANPIEINVRLVGGACR